ncbi:MMPL family transporter [Nocardia transvalensis]|uniref:MMPL family transporter n=1 Tax=Nocardia transvalensis TaxID=37333 RepID=UPI001893FFCB|nr:MMPL family transporter [Nocardia transvalensis]MBF6329926.1 MMPL family transporter [Nocardia transvalensis]
MLTRIATLALRMPRAILWSAVLILVLSGVFGSSATAHLRAGGFTPADTESTRASEMLADRFHGGAPNLVLLVTADGGVDGPAARAAGATLTDALRSDPNVTAVQSYWSVQPDIAQGLRSADRRHGIIAARVAGDDSDAPHNAAAVVDGLPDVGPDVTVRAGGEAIALDQINKQATTDVMIAEAIAVPLTGIFLVWVFGSLVAALLPVVMGVFAILTTLAILRLLTMVTDVSIYALNITTGMGLALAIDYGLFMVSRFREELGNGLDVRSAVVRTVQTAGRTVLFTALAVAISLPVLVIFPHYFLKSFAYAALAVVISSALAALLLLPTALALIGRRIDALDVRAPLHRLLHRPPRGIESESMFWYRVVRAVTRRPLPVATAVVVLLLLLGSPFLAVRFGFPDDRVLSTSASSRQVGDVLRTEFTPDPANTIYAVLPDLRDGPADLPSYASRLSEVDGVAWVASGAGTFVSGLRVASAPPELSAGNGAVLAVGTRVDPYTTTGSSQLDQLRAVPGPAPVLFTGAVAQNQDSLSMIRARLPLAIGLIVLITFVVLYLFTRSVVLPVKALALNLLSLSATFGAMVWVFQDGHLANLLGFTPTGYLVPTIPILMFCLAFGLSMDYEVFLLSRIREEWLASDRTASANTESVARGIARTGRIVTAAACLMAIVFFAMVSSQVSFIQLFGLGLTVAVLVDATLVRGVLVPALMRLLGRFNWWNPLPVHRRPAAPRMRQPR